MADALVLGASTSVCGFKSHLLHQTDMIRIFPNWGGVRIFILL